MIAEHAAAAESGAKLVELRLDFLRKPPNLKRLLGERKCATIVTCRRSTDGGIWQGSEQERLTLLRAAIVDGVEYVDLEEDIAGAIPRYGTTKRIVSLHNFTETPANLDEIHARLAKLNPDIIKIATMANDPHDCYRMLTLVRDAKIPTVGLCMGEFGVPTRILAGKFGAPFSFANVRADRALAPGQLTYQQMDELYRYDSIDENTEIYGVVADPVGHSLSPILHNKCFANDDLNKRYVPFRVPAGSLRQFVQDWQELGLKGLSVTIPHKEEMVRLLQKADESVTGIGATNTVVFREGERVGYNSDYRAAMQSIDQAFGKRESENLELRLAGKVALVLGAGGVARAIVYGLKRRSAEVVICSRTLQKAEDLAAAFKAKAIGWTLRHSVKADLIVNCTPIGMFPNMDETPFERAFLRHRTAVFDTVYNPEQTLLIKEARQAECPTVTGVEMFVGQAAVQYKLFTDRPANTELMLQTVRRSISAVRT